MPVEGTEAEENELRAVLTQLAAVHAETLRLLDRAEKNLDETLAYLAQQQPGTNSGGPHVTPDNSADPD